MYIVSAADNQGLKVRSSNSITVHLSLSVWLPPYLPACLPAGLTVFIAPTVHLI